jgi:hypothetical protein
LHRKRAGWKKLVMDLPPGVQRRRECVPLVFESSGYVAKLARRCITEEWAGRARRAQGREGEKKGVQWQYPRAATCPPRCTIGTRPQPSRIYGMRCWSSCQLTDDRMESRKG